MGQFSVGLVHVVPNLPKISHTGSIFNEETTHNVLRVWGKFNIGPFRVFTSNHFGNNMCIRNGGHTCKAIVFSFASIDLISVFFNSGLCSFELGTVKGRELREAKKEIRQKTYVYQSIASFVIPPKPQVPPILITGRFDLIFPPFKYFTSTSSNSRTV